MLAKTALLIVSNPYNIGKILPVVQQCVNKLAVLYIQLLSSVHEPVLTYRRDTFTAAPQYSKIIHGIYSQAANHCKHMDVHVLLSSLKYDVASISTRRPIELVVFDKQYAHLDVDSFLDVRVANKTKDCKILTFVNESTDKEERCEGGALTYNHTVLGGTFDHLHIAHKVFLSEAILRSDAKVTVGITDDDMTKSKTLSELIQPLDQRIEYVRSFVEDVCPEIDYNLMPIKDAYGPTADDPSMELIVVSKETASGGQKVNELRESNGLRKLEVVVVELLDEPHRQPEEEAKISSSTERMRLLGSLLRPVTNKPHVPAKPYTIGLTGMIGSGKSTVIKDLTELGATVIDSDKIGHEMYLPGTVCYASVVETFGKEILAPDGTIDRKKLGPIVFGDRSKLAKLNSLVWPAIANELCNRRAEAANTSSVVVFEAAILIQAGWDNFCHEVWSMIIPPEEAIARLQERNGFSYADAKQRVDSQPTAAEYVKAANVVLCSLWNRNYTKQQVQRAWDDLQKRLCS